VAGTDHFSGVARAYAAYRPTYPAALFAYVSSLTASHRRAWDCGAGSGQATGGLLSHYSSVVATDISRSQLSSAEEHTRVRRVACAAERSALADGSVDLVAVAQALHWMNLPAFYAEVRRVVATGGAIAVWSYDLAVLGDPFLDTVFRRFYEGTLGQYWPLERRLVDDRYRTISFPFVEAAAPEFSMVADWTLDELLGYVGTWSAVSRYRASEGSDPAAMLAEQLASRWGRAERRRIQWPLVVRTGRI
jgi:ubiquinone/menaquinone biosynthesis C-methylase UbiE